MAMGGGDDGRMTLPAAPVPPSRPAPFGRDVVVLGLGFAGTLFIVASLIWWMAGFDPVASALPKLVGMAADATLAIIISLVLWRISAMRLGVKALVACLLSLIGACVSAVVDRGLQIYMTRPDVAPIDPQYVASVVTFTTSELFGWSCLYLALQYASQIRETERRLAEARQLAATAQLRALQYQVSPHFLFNTLNSVAGLIEEGAREPARDMVLRLAGFLRRTLALDPLSDVALKDEIALQLDYLAIEELRFSDRLALRVDLPPDAARVPVPALIWMICPPNAAARARYSRSGSMTITSSSRLRNMPAISCLTVKDLPPPDVPSTNPLEFMWLRRSARIGLPLRAFDP